MTRTIAALQELALEGGEGRHAPPSSNCKQCIRICCTWKES